MLLVVNRWRFTQRPARKVRLLEDGSMTYDNARIEAAVLWLAMMVVLLIPWLLMYP